MDGQVFEGQLRGVEVKVGCETFSGFITDKALESMMVDGIKLCVDFR